MDISRSWQRLLQEIELAKNYHKPYELDGAIAPRNPVLDYLLPSLLYIKLVTIFDEALVHFVFSQGLAMPRHYNDNLNGRIELLGDCELLIKPGLLHEIREARNLLAHETAETIAWARLDADLVIIEKELQNLGFVGNRPDYRYFGEKAAARESEEPGVAFTQHYRYGVKHNERVILETSFTNKIFRDNAE